MLLGRLVEVIRSSHSLSFLCSELTQLSIGQLHPNGQCKENKRVVIEQLYLLTETFICKENDLQLY